MNDQPRSVRPGDDRELLRSLKALAADYEPDVDSIRHRATRGTAPSSRVARLHFAPEAARIPATGRDNRPVLLSAAAVLLVMGGILGVAATSGGPVLDLERTAPPLTAATPTSTTTTARTPSPTRSSPDADPSQTRTTAADPTPSGATGTTGTGPIAIAVRHLGSTATATGTDLDLARPPLIDWIAVGTRADGKQVRAKAAAADPELTLDQPGSATSVAGPFRTSWTAGQPEQDHVGASRWLRANGRSGLAVTVAASRRTRTLTLYTGTRDLRGTLSVSGKGLTAERTALKPASATPRPVVVTVTLPPTAGPTRVELSGTPDGAEPSVYLVAVTLAPAKTSP